MQPESRKGKVIGIVGGMGPESGLMLFNSILSNTKVGADQEHIPVVLMSFPDQITDRTEFLEGRISVNPAANIARIIHKLETAGADVIGLACNTAYAPRIFDVLLNELEKARCFVQVLNMPAETAKYMQLLYPSARRIGVMATTGTYKHGEYYHLLRQMGYDVVLPAIDFQEDVIHRMIYDRGFGLKANPGQLTTEAASLMEKALTFFRSKGTDVIILGCTELPIALKNKKNVEGMALIDSIEAMALALIREASLPVIQSPGLINNHNGLSY